MESGGSPAVAGVSGSPSNRPPTNNKETLGDKKKQRGQPAAHLPPAASATPDNEEEPIVTGKWSHVGQSLLLERDDAVVTLVFDVPPGTWPWPGAWGPEQQPSTVGFGGQRVNQEVDQAAAIPRPPHQANTQELLHLLHQDGILLQQQQQLVQAPAGAYSGHDHHTTEAANVTARSPTAPEGFGESEGQ